MNDVPCLLTIGDFSTLEALHEQWIERDHDLTAMLREKLEIAKVVFPDDLPPDVASLGSQVEYAIGDEKSIATLTAAIAMQRDWLPITLPAGLALLGHREGWAVQLQTTPGQFRLLTLGRVVQQPEATWPGRFSPHKTHAKAPSLRLVAGSRTHRSSEPVDAEYDGDDPGPAAA